MRTFSTLFLVLALASPEVAKASATGLICGTVYDTYTHAPIPDAVVTLMRPDSSAISVQSDSRGVFLFQGLAYGDYSLRASRPGYNTILESVRVTAAATTVQLLMPRALLTVIREGHHDWSGLVNRTLTSDEYSPLWGRGFFNITGSAFQFLPFVPGLTFGSAPRMMR